MTGEAVAPGWHTTDGRAFVAPCRTVGCGHPRHEHSRADHACGGEALEAGRERPCRCRSFASSPAQGPA